MCGCYINNTIADPIDRIAYCSLHDAAEQMRDALEATMARNSVRCSCGYEHCGINKVFDANNAALRAAKGE